MHNPLLGSEEFSAPFPIPQNEWRRMLVALSPRSQSLAVKDPSLAYCGEGHALDHTGIPCASTVSPTACCSGEGQFTYYTEMLSTMHVALTL